MKVFFHMAIFKLFFFSFRTVLKVLRGDRIGRWMAQCQLPMGVTSLGRFCDFVSDPEMGRHLFIYCSWSPSLLESWLTLVTIASAVYNHALLGHDVYHLLFYR